MVKFNDLHEFPVFLAATKIPFSFTNSVPRNLAFLNLFRFHFSGSAAYRAKLNYELSENYLNAKCNATKISPAKNFVVGN
jgi:hypothetical protein